MIDGPTFTHPDLRIQFSVPPGYLMSNGTDAVTISGSAGKAQFRGGRFNGSLDNTSCCVFRQLTGGQVQFPVPPPQHIDDQRHAGGGHHRARQQPVRA